MAKTWVARLCVCVIGRGIIGTRSPRHKKRFWKLPGGNRKRGHDKTWMDTAIRSTFMETGLLIPRERINLVIRVCVGDKDTYIGFVLLFPEEARGLRPRPGVEEEARLITGREFLRMRDFLFPHRMIIVKFKLHRW